MIVSEIISIVLINMDSKLNETTFMPFNTFKKIFKRKIEIFEESK